MKCLWMFLALVSVTTALRGSPPEIIFPAGQWSNPVVFVRSTTTYTQECKATGVPQPTYKWYLNGTEIDSVLMRDYMRVDTATGTLTLLDLEGFSLQFSGMFQCVAINENGAAMTPYLYVMSTVIGIFDGSVKTEELTIGPSQYKNLTCKDVPYSIPPFQIQWTSGQEVIDPTTNERVYENVKDITDGERMVTDADGTLHIIWVDRRKDAERSFRCVGDNDILRLKSTKVYKLKMQGGLKNFRNPELKYNKDVVVMEKRDAALKCVFTYYKVNAAEKFEVTWFHQGNEVGTMSDSDLYEKNPDNPGILLVKNVQIFDGTNRDVEGEYLCVATLGAHEAQGKVHLKITAPPKFIKGGRLRSFSAPIGKDALFTCRTYSHNAYEEPVAWFQNGKPLIGCPAGMFECKTPNFDGSPQCISNEKKGDSIPDCTGVSEEVASISCNEGQKVCNSVCVNNDVECVETECEFPKYKCSDGLCIEGNNLCDGYNHCSDGADEMYCPGHDPFHVGPDKRLIVSSNRRELIVPNIQRDDGMCIQCMVKNEYGILFGDGCLTVIDNIAATLLPDPSYIVGPGTRLSVSADATTDPMYENQMKFEWCVYDKDDDSKVYSLPLDAYTDQFFISMTGKNLTIMFPSLAGDSDADSLRRYNIYEALVDNKYALNISHRYDEFIYNFTVEGERVIKPTEAPVVQASANLWFIAVILAIIFLFIVIALIICYMYRNRGGTYFVDKKEHQAGHNPEQELKDSGFQDVGRIDDDYYDEKPKMDEVSLTESVKPYDSDEDITEEYGLDISKFNEDGSFIGLYGDKKSKSEHKEATV